MDKPKYFYLDLDLIPYKASFEKLNYVYVPTEQGVADGCTESPVFDSAQKGYDFLQEHCTFTGEKSDYERKTIVIPKTADEVEKTVKDMLNDWIKTAKKFGGEDLSIKGYISGSGRKTKDLDDLEHKYQFNRYNINEKGEYVRKPKPPMHDYATEVLMEYDLMRKAPDHYEADALVVNNAERKGKQGCAMFVDKDLTQIMGSYFIRMLPPFEQRVMEYVDGVGVFDLLPNKDYHFTGLKCIMAQMVMGDQVDGYKGLPKAGPSTMYKLFKDLNTPEAVVEAVINLYKKKLKGDGPVTYTSWKGEKITKSFEDYLSMHCQLAYHERGAQDKLNPIKRYFQGLPISRYEEGY